jgi:hypothetical protein
MLDRAVRAVARPALEAHGFRLDGTRTLRREDLAKGTCRIVNVQVGTRSMAGRFTVNLGVYSPELFLGPGTAPRLNEAEPWHCLPGFHERLGRLMVSAWTDRWTRILGPSGDAWWKDILYGARDRWWGFSEDEGHTFDQVRRAIDHVRGVGLRWLEGRDDAEAMRREHSVVNQRLRPRA